MSGEKVRPAWVDPDLAKTGKLVLYWRLRLCEYTSRHVNLDKLDSLATELHLLPIEMDWLSFLAIRQNLWKARRAHRQAKILASKLREDHLEEMAKLAGALHGTSDTVAVLLFVLAKKRRVSFVNYGAF